MTRTSARVATLRLIIAALKDRDIAARSQGNADGISMTRSWPAADDDQAAPRVGIKMYEQGGRPELGGPGTGGIAIIERLPAGSSLMRRGAEAAIDLAIAETGARRA